MPTTCPRKRHDWDETHRTCRRCGARRTRLPKPKPTKAKRNIGLVPLQYGNPYCGECRTILHPGMLVAWRKADGRPDVICAACARTLQSGYRASGKKVR